MRKSELRKLPVLTATDAMAEQAGEMVRVRMYDGWDYAANRRKEGEPVQRPAWHHFVCGYQEGSILKLSVFLSAWLRQGTRTPVYEVFVDIVEARWITREFLQGGAERRWLTGMWESLVKISYGSRYAHGVCMEDRERCGKVWTDQAAEEGILALQFPDGMEPVAGMKGSLERLERWQEAVKERRRREAEEKETAPWDADMALVGAVPPSFERWMEREVVKDDYIFYEYRKGGAKTGWCRHCGKDVVLKAVPRHRKKMACPECGRECVLICAGRIRQVCSREGHCGQFLQKITGGFVLRNFMVTCTVETADYRNPRYRLHEYQRDLVRPGSHDRYIWGLYKNRYGRWCRQPLGNQGCYGTSGAVLWTRNLRAVSGTVERLSALLLMLKDPAVWDETWRPNIAEYLRKERWYPVIEMCAKAGMCTMARDMAMAWYRYADRVDERQTELVKILRLDGERFKRLRKIAAAHTTLYWLQKEKEQDTRFPDAMIKDFFMWSTEPEDLDFLSGRLTYRQIWNYLRKQESLNGRKPQDLLQTWKDYLDMAGKLQMDTAAEMVYRPKNLLAAHSETEDLLNRGDMEKKAAKIRKDWPKVDEVCGTIGKYEYASGDYLMRAPSGVFDIVREGMLLKHCIHTCDYYFDRITRRESYLLFLRRASAPDSPWYTIEAEPGGNIRQKRTLGDNQNEDLNAALPFLREWQETVKRRLTEEEQELARAADAERKENYRNLRKNKNRIWHGKLAGKLLADVLEQDFMAAM